MSDIEKELELMAEGVTDEPEEKLPSIKEQKAIVAKLKKLEAEGKLTQEVMEEYFGKFEKKGSAPIH